MNWIVYLSDGSIHSYKDLFSPGSKSPWLIVVELIKEKNTSILRRYFKTEEPFEELKKKYYGIPHDLKPKIVYITNVQIIVNGKIHNAATTAGNFPTKKKISNFWIYQQCDFSMGGFSQESDDFISFSFVLDNKYRIFQWINKSSGNTWIEVVGMDDPRNKMPSKEFV